MLNIFIAQHDCVANDLGLAMDTRGTSTPKQR